MKWLRMKFGCPSLIASLTCQKATIVQRQISSDHWRSMRWQRCSFRWSIWHKYSQWDLASSAIKSSTPFDRVHTRYKCAAEICGRFMRNISQFVWFWHFAQSYRTITRMLKWRHVHSLNRNKVCSPNWMAHTWKKRALETILTSSFALSDLRKKILFSLLLGD